MLTKPKGLTSDTTATSGKRDHHDLHGGRDPKLQQRQQPLRIDLYVPHDRPINASGFFSSQRCELIRESYARRDDVRGHWADDPEVRQTKPAAD